MDGLNLGGTEVKWGGGRKWGVPGCSTSGEKTVARELFARLKILIQIVKGLMACRA